MQDIYDLQNAKIYVADVKMSIGEMQLADKTASVKRNN